jgi:hypothetical protein
MPGPTSRNAGGLRAARSCHALLVACRRRGVPVVDRGCDLGDSQAGAGLAGRVLVPAAQRGFDPAGADPGPAWRVQAGQDGLADAAGPVDAAVAGAVVAGDVTSAVMTRTCTPRSATGTTRRAGGAAPADGGRKSARPGNWALDAATWPQELPTVKAAVQQHQCGRIQPVQQLARPGDLPRRR